MSFQNWFNYLCSAEKSIMSNGVIRDVFYKFPDGKQMAEEYSVETGDLQRRCWRRYNQLMVEPDWVTELGIPPQQISDDGEDDADNMDHSKFTPQECNMSPILNKFSTKTDLEWRIRNLPYPIDVYSVKAALGKPVITVRTSNNKYCEVIEIPELVRCNVNAEQANISVQHEQNTLIITYKKPDILCEMEEQVMCLLKDTETDIEIQEMLEILLAS